MSIEDGTPTAKGPKIIKITLIALAFIAVCVIIYAASTHAKASKQHLANERAVADGLKAGTLSLKSKEG